jgi:hypothetical protein
MKGGSSHAPPVGLYQAAPPHQVHDDQQAASLVPTGSALPSLFDRAFPSTSFPPTFATASILSGRGNGRPDGDFAFDSPPGSQTLTPLLVRQLREKATMFQRARGGPEAGAPFHSVAEWSPVYANVSASMALVPLPPALPSLPNPHHPSPPMQQRVQAHSSESSVGHRGPDVVTGGGTSAAVPALQSRLGEGGASLLGDDYGADSGCIDGKGEGARGIIFSFLI